MPILLLILQAVQGVAVLAPDLEKIIVQTKNLIAALFEAGVITKEQQDASFLQVDAIKAMVAAGIVPPHWKVEADPK